MISDGPDRSRGPSREARLTFPDHVCVEARINLRDAGPGQIPSVIGPNAAICPSPVEASLLQIIQARTSQINGRAFGINGHASAAIRAGDPALRLLALDAWREASFTAHERVAALALSEAVTLICGGQMPTRPGRTHTPFRGE
jgi:hypothetical protein